MKRAIAATGIVTALGALVITIVFFASRRFPQQTVWILAALNAATIFILIILLFYIFLNLNDFMEEDVLSERVYNENHRLKRDMRIMESASEGVARDLKNKRMEISVISEKISEGLLILNRKGEILSCNKSAAEFLERDAENLIGINVSEISGKKELESAFKSALSGEDSVQIAKSDGIRRRILASPALKGGFVLEVVCIITDVTETHESEKLRREFTSNVSHELKTPLTSILGYAEIMMNGVARPEDMPEFSRNIYHEAQRMIDLVRDLMFISKLEESSPMVKEQINILDMSCGVAGRLASKAAKHGVTLNVFGDSAVIYGIPSVLEEMIYNLLDNAIKYNKKGGEASISVKATGVHAILETSDTGTGIPKSEQERIFERFYRVDKSHSESIEGTGLGLAIVKHGAMLHGAKIEMDSDESGSRFRLVFDCGNEAPAQVLSE